MEPILYKYVPKRLEDFYNDTHTLQFIKTMIGINNLNILLLGSSGVGKTSLLNTIVSEYYKDIDLSIYKNNILYINNLNEQGISYYRNELKFFCKSSSLIKNKKKIVLIDDLDLINEQGQQIFRSILDNYVDNVHCIASCSNTLRVIDSIQSRMNIIKLNPLKEKDLVSIIRKICLEEKINILPEVEDYIISISNNSIRVILNYLEKFRLLDMDITMDLAVNVCTNISLKDFDKYTLLCKNDKDVKEAIKILYNIYDRGYSVMDILDNYFIYIKATNLLTEDEKYKIVQYICKYITIFNTIHEDVIELTLFTSNIITIF